MPAEREDSRPLPGEGRSRVDPYRGKVPVVATDRRWNGVQKQRVNRLLEPFSWITVVLTATDWQNFFALRCHKDAHPDLQRIAGMMCEARANSEPQRLEYGWWHLPFVTEAELAEVCAGG